MIEILVEKNVNLASSQTVKSHCGELTEENIDFGASLFLILDPLSSFQITFQGPPEVPQT